MAGLGGVEYPLGGICVLGGVTLMVLLEHVGHIMHNGSDGPHPHPHAPHGGGGGVRKASARTTSPSQSLRSMAVEASLRGGASPADGGGCGGGATAAVSCAAADSTTMKQPQSGGSCGELAAVESSGFGASGHTHVCVSRGSASNWMTAGAIEAMGSIRLKVVAYLFELGCIFHRYDGQRKSGLSSYKLYKQTGIGIRLGLGRLGWTAEPPAHAVGQAAARSRAVGWRRAAW